MFCLQPTGTQYRVRPGIQQKHPSFYHHCSVYNPLGHSVEYGLASNRNIHLSIIIVLFTAHWDTVSVRPGIQQKHPSFYHHCSVYSPLGHSVEYGLASNRNIHLSIIIVLFTAHWDTVSSTAWHPTETSIFLSSLFCLQPTGTQCRVRPGIQQKHPSFYHHCSVYSPLGHSVEYGLASNRNIHLSIIIVLFTAHWDTVSSTAWHPTETSIFLSSLFCLQPTGTQCRVRPGIQQKHPSFYHHCSVYSPLGHSVRPGIQQKHPSFYHHCSVYSPLGHSVEYGLASNRDIHLSIIIVLFTTHWDTVSSTAWHPTETSIFLSSLFCLQPTGTQCRVRPGIQQKHPSFYHHCSVYNPLGHSIEYGLASNRNIHLSIIIVLFTTHWDTVSSTAWHPTETSIFLSSLFCLQPTGTQCRVRPGIQQKHPSFYHHCSVYSPLGHRVEYGLVRPGIQQKHPSFYHIVLFTSLFPLGHSVEYGLASNRNIHLSIIIVLFTTHWDTVSSTAWHPTETSIFLSSLFCLQPTGTQYRVRPGIQQKHPSFYHHCSVYNPLGHSVSTAWHPTETSIFLSSLFCLQPTGTQYRVRPGIQQKHPSFYHHCSVYSPLGHSVSTAWHPTESFYHHCSVYSPLGHSVRPGIQQRHPSFYHHCSVYSPLGHSVEYGLASNRNIHLSIIIVLFTAHWDTVSSILLSSLAWHPTETSIFLSSLFCLQPTGTQCQYGLASNRNIHLSIIIVLFTAHWDTVSSTAWHPTETSIFLSSLFCLQPTGTQCRVRPGIQQKHPSFYHHCSVYNPLGHSVEYGLASNRNIHLSIIIVLFTTHWDTVSSTAWHPTETSIFLSSLFCLQPTGTQCRVRPGIQQKHPSFYHHCSVYNPLGHHLSIIIVLFTAHCTAWHPTETSIFLSSLFCLQPTGTQCRVRPGIQQKHPSFYHHCSVYNPLGHSVEYGLASNRNIHLSIIIVLFTAHWDTVSSTAWHPTETSIFLSSLFCLQPTGTQYRVRPGIQQKHPSFYHHCSVYNPLGHSIEYGLASNRNIHLSIIIVLFTTHWDTVSVRPGIQQKHPSFYHHCSVYSPLGHSVSTAWHPTETSIFLSSLFCLQPTGTQCQYGLASNRNIHLSIIIVLFTAHWDTVSVSAWHPTETSIFLSSLFCLQPTGTQSIFLSSLSV